MSEANEQTAEQPAENADELAALEAEAETVEAADEAASKPEAPNDDESSISNQQAIAMAMGPAFAVLAPRWNVSDAEIEQLAQAYGDLADKYMPEGISVGVELNAFLVTALIIGPRLSIPRNDAQVAKMEAKRQERERVASGHAKGEAARRAAEKPDAAQDPGFDMTTGGDNGAPA